MFRLSLLWGDRVYRGLAVALAIILVLSTMPSMAASEPAAYVLVEDVTGRVWGYSDVEKLLNTSSYNGYNIGDYFYIVFDNDTVLSLHDMVDYEGFAAFKITPGVHTYHIQWFGYRQAGRMYFQPGPNYLKLETAPFLPIQYEWSDVSVWKPYQGSDGVGLVTRDGLFKIVFRKGQAWINVTYYDAYQGVVYDAFTVEVNDYPWTFHLDHFGSYEEKKEAGWAWFATDIMHLYEEAKITRLHGLLRLTYLVLITKNKAALDALNSFTKGFIYGFKAFIDLSQGNIVSYFSDVWENIVAQYDIFTSYYVCKFGHNLDQVGYFIVFDVFASPTRVLVAATAYNYTATWSNVRNEYITEVDQMKVESATAFYYNNTVVKMYSVYGGLVRSFITGEYIEQHLSGDAGQATVKLVSGTIYDKTSTQMTIPFSYRFLVDDISRYGGYVWFRTTLYGYIDGDAQQNVVINLSSRILINIDFSSTYDANMLYYDLLGRGYSVSVSGTRVTVLFTDEYYRYYEWIGDPHIEKTLDVTRRIDLDKIFIHAPHTHATISFQLYSRVLVKRTYGAYTVLKARISKPAILLLFTPRINPITLEMYTGNYTRINSAYAVQLLILNKSIDNKFYVPSYYLFSNPPKRPVVVDRDIYYDNDSGVVHIVYVLIDKEILVNKSIWSITYEGTTDYYTYNCTTHIDPVFEDTIISMYDLASMSFLKLDLEFLIPLLAPAVPPGKYGIPTYIWDPNGGKWWYIYDYYTITKLIEEHRTRSTLEQWEDAWNDFVNKYFGWLGLIDRYWPLIAAALVGFFILVVLVLLANLAGAVRGTRIVVSTRR